MISNLDPSAEIFLADLTRAQQRIERAQRQVSSGRKIETASDAPDQIDTILQLRAAQQHNTQLQANLDRAKTEADSAEQTLGTASQLLDRALVLGSEGTSPTSGAAQRQSIAGEVQGIQEQIVSFTRTAVEGRYIFGGDQDQQPPYDIDWTSPTGVNQLTTAASTRVLEDPAGGSFPTAQTAQEIFDSRNPDGTPAGDNVFAALNSLRTALLNDDSSGITDAIGLLHQASDRLNTQTASYGALQRRIQDASSFASSYDTRLQTELGQRQDADVAAAAIELSQGNIQIQAALSARARLPRTSLFDVLG
jgi:flagellar hook-associated protein 3 FlgL